MSVIKKWILYSTLVGLFCSRFYIVAGGLVLYLFYFVAIVNLILLAMMGITWFPQKLRFLLLYLSVSGVLGLLLGTNSVAGFLKSFVGIVICSVYSACFIRFVRFDASGMFRKYAHLAFYVAIASLLLIPLTGGRVVGPFNEPSAFARTCVPALVYYAVEWQRTRQHGLRVLILLAASVLTFSSLGILGMMVGIIFLGSHYRVGRILIPIVVTAVFMLVWTQSLQFQARMTDLVAGINTNDVRDLNESSLGVVLNALITEKQFAAHPIFGGGLGSHVVTHANFVYTIPGAMFVSNQLINLGEWDASSLFLRIVSELGLVGVIGTFWYLWYYFPWRGTAEEKSVAFAVLCYVFMKFGRSGEWFGSEVFFMFSIYTVVGAKARIQNALRMGRGSLSQTLLQARPAASVS